MQTKTRLVVLESIMHSMKSKHLTNCTIFLKVQTKYTSMYSLRRQNSLKMCFTKQMIRFMTKVSRPEDLHNRGQNESTNV